MSQLSLIQSDSPAVPAALPAAAKPSAMDGLFPAIPAAVCLCLGIAAFDQMPIHPVGYGVLCALAAALALLLTRRRALIAVALLGISFALLGIAFAQLTWYCTAPDDIVHYSSAEPRAVQVRLIVDAVPRQTPAQNHRPASQSAPARVLSVATRDGWQSAGGSVHLRLSNDLRALKIGDEVEVHGELTRIDPPGNPGEYDWQGYQRQRGIYCTLSCDGADARTVIASHGEGPLDRARRVVREALARGFADDRSVDLALTRALLLGDSDRALDEVREDFRRTGTTHHLTISGMHIGVLTGFVYFLCRVLRVPPHRSVCLAMAFAILYGFLTVPSPPILRSVLMCVAVGAGFILRRRLGVIQLLGVCLVIILLIQPMDLFNPGFQLSFACVAGLMLLASPLSGFFLSLENEHIRIARQIQRPTGLALWRLKARIGLINALAAGLIAWTLSMPLIAFHFRQINPWAIPASILLVPAVAFTLICGLLKVVLTLIIPASASLLAIPTQWSAAFMRWMVGMMAAMPGSEAPIPPIPVPAMLAFFALLLLPLVPRWADKRAVWIAPALAAILGLSIPLIAVAASRHLSTDVRLTCLSVGAGSCGVVELPGGRAIMVDCGAGDPGIYQRVIDPFLRYRGIYTLDTLYLTHGDSDHTNAAGQLIAAGRVKALAVHEGQTGITDLLAAAKQAGIQIRTLHRGDRVEHGSVRIDVLWPPDGEVLKGNDASLVLRLESAGKSILFPGDIGERPRHELAVDPARSDILIAPHHGSATPWTAELLASIRPQAIISSDGRKVSGLQAKFQQLAAPLPLYHTRDRGAITVELSPTRSPRITGWLDNRAQP